MRKSQYNTYIELENDDLLLYNSFADKFVVVPAEVLGGRNLESMSVPEIERTLPGLYSDLVEAGILVDDEMDEVSALQRRIEETDNNPALFHLHVNPTVDCNFRCWYCYEEHKAGTYMDLGVMERIFRLVDRVLARGEIRQFRLGFFGGEPLLHFERIARPVIEGIAAKCEARNVAFGVHFTSNGFLLDDSIIEFLGRRPCGFQITFDGHRRHHDKTRTPADGSGSYDRILTNIRKLLSKGIYVNVRVNYTGENLPEVPEIISDLSLISETEKQFLKIDLQKVWQDNTPWQTAAPQLQSIVELADNHGIACRSTNLLDYVKDSCYGNSRNHVLVNYNGDVYCCTARDFTKANRAGYLNEDGDVVWDDPEYMRRRMSARFNRPSCRKCRIAPLCSGGCRQNGLERLAEGDYCMYGSSDERKDHFVMVRFERLIMNAAQQKQTAR